jgi:putative tryptophan/tyrosine transport system substrate-binding protein
VHGQQPKIPVIGYLGARSEKSDAHLVTAFREGLNETGFFEGKNVSLEFRWADGKYEMLGTLAASLASLSPSVTVTTGTAGAAHAAKDAMATTPIVFLIGADPVTAGLVPSLNRPGGYLTGIGLSGTALLGKELELLCACTSSGSIIGILQNPKNSLAHVSASDLLAAGATLERNLTFVDATKSEDLEVAFAKFAAHKVGGVLVEVDAAFSERRYQIVELAAHYAIATMYSEREFVEVGGLISYGASRTDAYRKAGIYVGRVLKGEKPENLPVQLPTKFELAVNLKTAKALGLTIPPSLLATADEVIE